MTDVCTDDERLTLPETPDVAGQGRVTIRDVVDTTFDDRDEPQDVQTGRVQASFASVTAESTPAVTSELGPNCIGVTSRPGNDGEQTALAAGTVTVTGLNRSPITVTEMNGVYVDGGAPLLDGADANVAIEADGGSFVAFSASIPVATPLEVRTPALDGTGELAFGELVFAWTAGQADYVLIEVSPDVDDRNGGQVICQVPDDGCFTLPALATTFLLASDAPTYTVSVQRANLRVVEPDSMSAVEATVVSQVRGTLVSGVLP